MEKSNVIDDTQQKKRGRQNKNSIIFNRKKKPKIKTDEIKKLTNPLSPYKSENKSIQCLNSWIYHKRSDYSIGTVVK